MNATLETPPAEASTRPLDRYRASVEEYTAFRRDGFLVVRNLVPPAHIAELRQHTEDLMQGRLPQQTKKMAKGHGAGDGGVVIQGLEAPPENLSPEEKAQHFLRIHMLHRKLELHERYMLHPRVLDVLEVLIGPDVMAMQTMLFLKPPGKPGQGWHQDSYYIPTQPDMLCGAWIAIDDCDELNGGMWMAKGSGVEPIHPPCPTVGYGFGDKLIGDINWVKGVSDTDDEKNDLSREAAKYDHVMVEAKAGDVVFFNGHVLHRSKSNFTKDRFRRSFVSHYSNARSFTLWGPDLEPGSPSGAAAQDPVSKMANGSHILARGDTHLPFSIPRFGTPCAALLSPEQRRQDAEAMAKIIASMNHGLLGCGITDPNATLPNGDKGKSGY